MFYESYGDSIIESGSLVNVNFTPDLCLIITENDHPLRLSFPSSMTLLCFSFIDFYEIDYSTFLTIAICMELDVLVSKSSFM